MSKAITEKKLVIKDKINDKNKTNITPLPFDSSYRFLNC